MRNLRKKIATVTKEEAKKEITDNILNFLYESSDYFSEIFLEDANFFHHFSFEEYSNMSESEQIEFLKDWFEEDEFNDEFMNQTLEDIFKNKDLSEEEKNIYKDVYKDAHNNAMTNKQFLESFRRNINRHKNWNPENTVNPDFNKGMNKINCIRTRLQKKLS